MNTIAITMKQAFDILDRADDEYKPSHYFALFSGGTDSLVNTYVSLEWAKSRSIDMRVVHINTGIGIEETRQFARQTAADLDWRFMEYKTNPQVYIDLVTGKIPGFPGGFPGAPMHFFYYTRLKERRIADLLRNVKKHRSERVLLSTGVRRQESRIRMGYTHEYRKEKARVWVNPLFHASKDELLDVRDVVVLPKNMVSECLHMSGECLCGAMNYPGELAEIRYWYPNAAAYIDYINELTIEAGYPWGWDTPMKVASLIRAGQQYLDGFAPMCASCEARRSNETGTNATAPA